MSDLNVYVDGALRGLSADRLREIVAGVLTGHGVSDVDPGAQVAAWLPDLRNDVSSKVGGAVGASRVGGQPVWLSAACDDAVFGEGSENVSVCRYMSTDEVRLVAGSRHPDIMGYLLVFRESQCLGLIPVAQGQAIASNAMVQAMRVRHGQLFVLVHDGMAMTTQQADDMGLVTVDVRRVQAEMLRDPPRASSARDMVLMEPDMSVEFPHDFCYLHAVAIADRVKAVDALGEAPVADVILRVAESGVFEMSKAYKQGRCAAMLSGGLLHLSVVYGEAVSAQRDARVMLHAHGDLPVAGVSPDKPSYSDFMRGFGFPDEVARDDGTVILTEEMFDLSLVAGSSGGQAAVSVQQEVAPRKKRKDGKERFDCGVCGFPDVLKEGHEGRCRPPKVSLPSQKRLALVGDSLVTLDVRSVMAALNPVEKAMTIDANEFLSAQAQRAYMERYYPDAVGEGHSNATWATAFEVRYHGKFREEYLLWLRDRLSFVGSVDTRVSEVVRYQRPALEVLGLVDRGSRSSSAASSGVSVKSSASVDTSVSVLRLMQKFTDIVPAMHAAEARMRCALKEAYRADLEGGTRALGLRVRSDDMAMYRKQLRSCLTPLLAANSNVAEFYSLVLHHGCFALSVLYGMMSYLGAQRVHVVSCGVNFAYIGIAEYEFLLPLPQQLFVRGEDYAVRACDVCGGHHWIKKGSATNSHGCGVDQLERDANLYYQNLLSKYGV